MDVEKNQFTASLCEVVAYTAFYKVLKRKKIVLEVIGYILHKGYILSLNADKRRLADLTARGSFVFSEEHKRNVKISAESSRKILYKDGYIVDYVAGDGQEFDLGTNTDQCPVERFCQYCDAREFLRYICALDFINSEYMKSGLVRKKCLADHDEYCELRWKQGEMPDPRINLTNLKRDVKR